MDYSGLYQINEASWPAISTYILGNSGQVDLFSGHNNNYIARLGATSENSDRGALVLYDPDGDVRARVNVDEFDEGQVQTYGTNGVTTSILGSVTGANDGYLELNNNSGSPRIKLSYDLSNKGRVKGDLFEGEKITIASDGSDFSGIFSGGKGVRIKSIGNTTADLTLEANNASSLDGLIASDPNYSNSNLKLKSRGNIHLLLDNNNTGNGNHFFRIDNDDTQLFLVSSSRGGIMAKSSAGVDEPHFTISDKATNSYGRLNIGNSGFQNWQIAGKPSGSTTSKYLLFHLTDTDGTTGDDMIQIRGDGNAFIRGVWAPISDIRLKEDIVPLKNSLDEITKLNGYNYNWKDPNKKTRQTGVIAQEVQEVFPNLVVANKNGELSVNYDGLIPHLIESVKELRKEIEELKKAQSEK